MEMNKNWAIIPYKIKPVVINNNNKKLDETIINIFLTVWIIYFVIIIINIDVRNLKEVKLFKNS